LHIRDQTRIDEGERFVLPEQCFPRRECVRVERDDVEASVLFETIEEIDGCVVAGMGDEAVERFREYVIEDDRFRERSIVNSSEYRKRITVGAISSIGRCKENGRIE
jgi:hypothetical protein